MTIENEEISELKKRVIANINYIDLIKKFTPNQIATAFSIHRETIVNLFLEQEKFEKNKLVIEDEENMQTNGEWLKLKRSQLYHNVMGC